MRFQQKLHFLDQKYITKTEKETVILYHIILHFINLDLNIIIIILLWLILVD